MNRCVTCGASFKALPTSPRQLHCSRKCARISREEREFLQRTRRRAASPAWQADPVFGQLHDLAANAQPMMPELWEQKKREFEHRAAEWKSNREPSRARERRVPAPKVLA